MDQIGLDCMVILYEHVFNPTHDVYKVDLNYVSNHNEPLTITMFIVYSCWINWPNFQNTLNGLSRTLNV